MAHFNKQEYDACDNKAKTAVRAYLDSKGIFTNVYEDYGPDIQSWLNIYHEVEIKSSWEDEWPDYQTTIHVPYRKKKYLDSGKKVMFWVLNSDCTQAWHIDGKHMKEEYVNNIPNTRYPDGEDFYCIPVSLCQLIEVSNGTTETSFYKEA